ncbi:MAG: aspartate 1-decarboxylase [Candidatus Cloacimonetes bacterium]|nr:aspartate 1-decarboxylase [Candidatus Cloacimonadota bacterium]
MLRNFLISKIHRANVTCRDLNYVGSITIDKKLLTATGMKDGEKVEVYNISNGNRFATYIIEGESGSGTIGINGAAARLVSIGDKIIIVNYGLLDADEMKKHNPRIIIIEDNFNLSFRKI